MSGRAWHRGVLSAWIAVSAPAWGQDVSASPVVHLHEVCLAHGQDILQRNWHVNPATAIDNGRFCSCADASVEKDPDFVHWAAMQGSHDSESSRIATLLEQRYFLDGLECYSKLMEWPRRPAASAGSRSLEEVRQVIERHRGAIYARYNAELKTNPALAGKMIFELTIEPGGEVSQVTIVSSEISDDAFIDDLKSQFLAMKFDDRPVAKLMLRYPVEFQPH